MSIGDKLSESVEHGLKIAEYIQENRENIQKAIGRSSIRDQDRAENAAKWKALIEKTISTNNRSEGSKGSTNGEREGSGSEVESPFTREGRDLSTTENTVTGSLHGGDNSGRNGADTSIGSGENKESDRVSIGKVNRGRSVITTGNDKPKEGNQDYENPHGSNDGDGGASNKGSTDGGDNPPSRILSVKETTQEDLKEIMEESLPSPVKKLTNLSTLSEATKDISNIPAVVKKTTGKNSVSMKSTERSGSGHGATQSVGKSPLNQDSSRADVENAQDGVITAEMTQMQDQSDISQSLNNNNEILDKLNEILENQKKIMDLIPTVQTIKEEINNVKKILTNQGLALSTIDGYISELMIVIPKSGKNESPEGKAINPDLRMVIGRDHTRGRSEVTKKYNQNDKIDIGEDIYVIPEVDDVYLTKDIDNRYNNAANFVPSNDYISEEIIKNIVENEVGDPDLIDELYGIINSGIGVIPLEEIYAYIRSLLDSMNEMDRETYEAKKKAKASA